MPIEKDDQGRRWETERSDTGYVLSQHEALTLAEKGERLARAFGKDALMVAEATYTQRVNYPHYPERYRTEWRDKCPAHIGHDDVHKALSYCREGMDAPHRLFIDLGSIARGEDAYGQTDYVLASNYRSLKRDYPNVFTDISYSNVDTLGAYVGNLSAELTDILTGLQTEYLLYDESDCSELEYELVSQSWEYTDWDIRRWLEENDQEAYDLWEALEGIPAGGRGTEGQSMRECLWWEANSENGGNPWHEMEYMSVVWDLDEACPAFARILSAYFAYESQPGQETLPGMDSHEKCI
jgi:hypothetical protein